MNKETFLKELRSRLTGLPQDDIEERLSFYSEMIDDRMEEGCSEEEAVAGIGTVDEIAEQTAADTPLTKLVKEKVKPKRTLKAWEIVLIVLGFPVWFPLLAAAAVIILALYITVWAIIISLWAVEVSLCACAFGGIAVSVAYFIQGFGLQGVAMLGIGLLCAGISVFAFFGCKAATKGILRLTKKVLRSIKTKFVGKKENEK